MKIKKENRVLLLSMILGDGYLSKDGYIKIRHCEKQLEYLEWKKKLIRHNGFKTTDSYMKDNNGFVSYEITTKTYKFLKLYRRVFYQPKKNILKLKFLNKLTPLHLAIWYMDDGSLSRRKLKNNTYSIRQLFIHTGLNKEDNMFLVEFFKLKWNINFYVSHDKKDTYRLCCGQNEAKKFIKIIEKYVSEIKCMLYKIDVNSY